MGVGPIGQEFAREIVRCRRAKNEARHHRRLLEMARQADDLQGKSDAKLQNAIPVIKGLLDEGYHPIVFCRFIPTAEYVARELRSALPKKVAIEAELLAEAFRERVLHTDDAAEGPRAFLEHRDPDWECR